MNQRFKELCAKAGFIGESMFPVIGTCQETALQNLIELVAKECLNVVNQNIHGPCGIYDYSYTDENAAADSRAQSIYADISYHFGVKE
jgi:hypothetical protein